MALVIINMSNTNYQGKLVFGFTKILNGFPTPKFLDIPFAGLSISDTAVRCIKFGKKRSGLYLEKFYEKNIPVGIVTSGQVNDAEKVTEILKELKKELGVNHLKVSLPEEKAYLFTTKIPVVSEQSVKSAIESKIEDNVPVSPLELTFDYKVMAKTAEDHLNVVVSALPTTLIDAYVDMVESGGFSLLSLEIESQAMTRALLSPDTVGIALIVHFDKEKFGLYVESDAVVHFTSTISLGSEASNSLAFLSQEIKKLYTYWHTLKENAGKSERQIRKIIICGEQFDEDVVAYLSAHNQSAVVLGNVWTNVLDINQTLPQISFTDSLRYASAVGLALPSDILI